MGDQNDKKRARILLEEPESDLPEVKRLREDLLNIFEDDDDNCTTSQDLDSFMKSFEEEISAPATALDSGDLGFLLEASDDELGLPPPVTAAPAAELIRVASNSSGISELWEFEDQMANFDSFDFGVESTENVNGGSSEYVAIDGLFDYSDFCFGSGDFGCQPETLPAQ